MTLESWRGRVCWLTCKHWETPGMASNISKCNMSLIHLGVQGQFQYWLAILFGAPASLIILVTVIGNLLVLCFKARVGKRQTTLLIWNLGLADFLVGVIVLPMGVTTVIARKWLFGRFFCRLWVSCDVIFCTASIVTLCTISFDRYIGVTRPLRYKVIITKTKVVCAIVSIWIFSISILLATLRYDRQDCIPSDLCHVGNEVTVVHSVILAFFLPASITLLLYWKIYQIAEQRERGLADGFLLFGENFLKDVLPTQLRIHCGGGPSVSRQQNVIRMHKKAAKTLGVVVSAFLFCWLPFFILYLISYHCGNCVPGLTLDITTWLGYCNSMINPVIYAFTVDEFHSTVKKMASPFIWVLKKLCPSGFQESPPPPRPTPSLPRDRRAYSVTAQGLPVPLPEKRLSLKRLTSTKDLTRRTVHGRRLPAIRETDIQDPLWSAKLYCVLVSSKETGL